MPAPNLQLLALLLSKFGKGGPKDMTGTQHGAHTPARIQDPTARREALDKQYMASMTPSMARDYGAWEYRNRNPGMIGADTPGLGPFEGQYGFGGIRQGGERDEHGNWVGGHPVGDFGFLGGGPTNGLANMNHQGSSIAGMFPSRGGLGGSFAGGQGGMNDFLGLGGGGVNGITGQGVSGGKYME